MISGPYRRKRNIALFSLFVIGALALLLVLKTARDLLPTPADLSVGDSQVRKPELLDRTGFNTLSVSYENRWSAQTVPLYEIPPYLRTGFIESEDRRFFSHGGVDWLARAHALAQDLLALRLVRGSSTITEQVVRMIYPRPRTFWSKWLEGIEAARLEKRFSKNQILEFYLNQVPYGHQRRGVVEASHFYFDRDPATLNIRECLALAVLVRAPSGLDPRKRLGSSEKRILNLAGHMRARGFLSEADYRAVLSEKLQLAHSSRIIEAPQFVQYVLRTVGTGILRSHGSIRTSLDGRLQQKVGQILWNRTRALASSGVGDGAALVVDNRTGEVLAWVSESSSAEESKGWVDAVTVRRQPGSTLKPFLYSLALEMGWTAATLIEDSPLLEPVNSGLHLFRNYSRTYYGPVRLRVALGNSLNTPAIRTIRFTGTERFLERLHALGIKGLKKPAEFYGHGLALGDGEVSLFELVQAYSALARHGAFLPLRVLCGSYLPPGEARQVIDPGAAAIVADILSDPQARILEFGEGNLLRLPSLTGIKTGTSSDHRDCWTVGISDRYTVGVWMGNLDDRPTRGISGAIGPALVLRAIFAELDRDGETGAFTTWPGLETVNICSVSGLRAGPGCPHIQEKFLPGSAPVRQCTLHSAKIFRDVEAPARTWPSVQRCGRFAGENSPLGAAASTAGPESTSPRPVSGAQGALPVIRLLEPSSGLQIALDPRIPPALQAFTFKISQGVETERVQWVLNNQLAGETGKNRRRFLWSLRRGRYTLFARVWPAGCKNPVKTPEVSFVVK
ncbi:MAG: transglycosylase domain-containing protein [Syntrophobacteraceae bacterium]|nr:transglycosylase domain-containing protein [Syntrophobacteraceae bacterium]